jgi:hypothetical protein
MVEEAQALGRLTFVAGANQRLQERLKKFGITALMTTRQEALERSSEYISR